MTHVIPTTASISVTCTSRDTMQGLRMAEAWSRDVPLSDLTVVVGGWRDVTCS